jgi:hypothetical protein
MPDDPKALQRAAERLAREMDAISGQFAKQLAKVFRAADASIKAWLSTAPPSIHVKRQVRQALQASGFEALARAATQEPFDTIAGRVLRGRSVDVGRVEGWRAWHFEDLRDEGIVISRALGGAVMRGSISRRAQRAIPQELAKILEHAEGRVQTLYDTAVSVYGRQVEAESAGDDPTTRFAYFGPVDQKTREFCLDHVGKVYTRAEIDRLDNGQLSNVFLTAGGWNCRHQWMEIAKSSELYDFQGTGERAPEIQDAVNEVAA